ncbi:tyrosine-type recombinase/integrase [bacterium]|nr:tyrosine-type recombinase/integrase [bacterium]
MAKSMLRDMRGRIERNDWGLIDNEASWDEVTKAFLDNARQTIRDIDQVRRTIKLFEKFRPVKTIKQITMTYATGYRDWRLAQRVGHKGRGDFVSPRTVNRELGTLKTMLNKAVAWGLIGSNPLARLKPLRNDNPVKQRRALAVEEVEALFEVSPEYLRNVWRFFMITGMRRNEVVGLRWEDIDFERRTVTVSASRAKSHKAREIPIDDHMMEVLHRLKKEAAQRKPVPAKRAAQSEQQLRNFSRDHVFVNQANSPWRNNLLRAFYFYCRRAGIMDAKRRGAVDLHSLRVTFTSLAIEHGASPRAIQSILGHSTLGLTMGIYAKATDRSKRDAVAALPFASITAPPHVLKLVTPAQKASVPEAYANSVVGS